MSQIAIAKPKTLKPLGLSLFLFGVAACSARSNTSTLLLEIHANINGHHVEVRKPWLVEVTQPLFKPVRIKLKGDALYLPLGKNEGAYVLIRTIDGDIVESWDRLVFALDTYLLRTRPDLGRKASFLDRHTHAVAVSQQRKIEICDDPSAQRPNLNACPLIVYASGHSGEEVPILRTKQEYNLNGTRFSISHVFASYHPIEKTSDSFREADDQAARLSLINKELPYEIEPAGSRRITSWDLSRNQID